MVRSIRNQLLLPFAVGLALLAIVIGVASALVARNQAKEELQARADRAGQVVSQTVTDERERFASDAQLFAQLLAAAPVDATDSSAALARLARQRELTYISVSDAGDRAIATDGPAAWESSPLARRLRERARDAEEPQSATGVSNRGTPWILGAARTPRGRLRVVTVGRPIDRDLLAPAESATGVLVDLGSGPGRPGAFGSERGTRTFKQTLALDGTSVPMVIRTSNRRVEATTWSILLVTCGGSILVLLVSLALLQWLVSRAVVSPVNRLTRGLRRFQDGDHQTRMELDGSDELRTLAEGFNRMTATVGEQHRRLERLATTDPLTGVLNHRAFHDAVRAALVHAERVGEPVAMVATDLDHFKRLNDTHGHAHGDKVLQMVADALRSTLRESDSVGRVGGEEFAQLLPGAGAEEAMEIADRARAAISSIKIDGTGVTCSAGVAVFPDDTLAGPELLALADSALYAAKANGRARTCRYEPGHSAQLTLAQQHDEVRTLLEDLSLSKTLLQPIVSLNDRRVVGYEALTRFSHPSGRRPPEWFGMARRCGLGPELQALALRKAFAIGGRPEGTFLAVNVEPSSLATATVGAVLPEDLTDTVIEITEQELITDPERLKADLKAFRDRGARIALDDTGAGYAGLSHIVALSPEVIKVDRMLVAGISEDPVKLALLDAFATFARRTGATLCAEGIESVDDLEVLVELGIEQGQGYLFAAPQAGWATPALAPARSVSAEDER